VASDTVAAVVDRGPCHPRSPTAATTTQIRARGNGVHWNLTWIFGVGPHYLFECRLFMRYFRAKSWCGFKS